MNTFGKGRLFIKDVKFPRSKSKRIINKWLKRQSIGIFGDLNIKFRKCTITPHIPEFIAVSSDTITFTIDEFNTDNLKMLMSGESK